MQISIFAQQHVCNTKINPNAKPLVIDKGFLKQQKGVVYTVPVVVHVLHDGTGSFWVPTDLEIENLLDSVSMNFRKLGSSTVNRDVFDTIWADVEIDFCLVDFDESDNPTSGVIYHNIGYNFMYGDFFSHVSIVNFWDDTQYLNLVFINQGSGSENAGGMTLSRPTFDETAAGMPAGTPNHVVLNASFYREPFVNMITHEFGHYFGIQHTWDASEPLDDTPCQANTQSYINENTCNSSWLTDNTCDDDTTSNPFWGAIDPPDMIENFMDYTLNCDKMFTNQQADYMRTYLNTNYAGYINSNKCDITNIVSENITEGQINIYPNPSTGIFTIEGNDIKEIEIIDITGKIIYNVIARNGVTWQSVNLSNNPKGIYSVRIKTNNSIIIKKIVKF